MAVKLDKLDRAGLIALRNEIDAALAVAEKRDKAAALAAARAAAKKYGFEIAELIDPRPKRRKRSPSSIRYRHPENPALTWSGRGRKPRWFADYVAAGNDLATLTVAQV